MRGVKYKPVEECMAGPRRSEEARFLLLTRNGPSCLKQHSSVPHSALVKQWVAACTQR